MSSFGSNIRRVRPEDLRVNELTQPGWVSGMERVPVAGDQVYCTEGMAEVVRVLGKTGNGSRLLELRLLEASHPPFFVASSNIRIPPAPQ